MSERKLIEERAISVQSMPPGEHTCNAKLSTRDGYCQSPGVAPYKRCPNHGGQFTEAALDIFKKAVPLDIAVKLDALIKDTLSMDNELATGKAMLVQSLEDYYRCSHVLTEFQENPPVRPEPGSSAEDAETYKLAVQLHIEVLQDARKGQAYAFKQSHALIRTLAIAVGKNSQIKEGAKFQLDAKQVASILKIQLEVMRVHCKGCPKLRDVLKGIQEGTKDIPIHSNFSNSTKEAIGKRAYKGMMEKVNQIGDELYPEE